MLYLYQFLDATPEIVDACPDMRKFLVQYMQQEKDRDGLDWNGQGSIRQALAMGVWEAKKGEAHIEALKKVATPVLVAHGKHDNLIPFDSGKELAGLIPDSKLA